MLRFGFLGRLVDEKGLGLLIEACRRLPAKGWTLRIAGEGAGRRDFEERASDLPVQFEGYVEASDFLSGIDVLVCAPLWDEPFGLTTLEAYAAGCRVIGSARGVIGEVAERIEPGWTVPPGDVDALAATMQRAIAHGGALPAHRQPLVDALLAELGPDAVAQTYLDLYQTVCRAPRATVAANG